MHHATAGSFLGISGVVWFWILTILGIGGVGSWAAEALARSGIGAITLIDLDHVVESNVNRQIQALEGQFGRAKVEAMGERIQAIHPGCRIQLIEEFAAVDNLERDRELSALLAGQAAAIAPEAEDADVMSEARDALQQALQQEFAHEDWVNDVAFSPDGVYLATASEDGAAIVWDLTSGRERFNLYSTNSAEAVRGIAFSMDGEHLATALVGA